MVALSPKQEKFVRLWFEGNMTNVEMAEACNVDITTVYRWRRNPKVRAVIEDMIADAAVDARTVYARNARRAAQTTLLYLQAEPIRGKQGQIKGHRLMYPKQARQAAADIHAALRIPVKGTLMHEGGETEAVQVVINLGDNGKIRAED